MSDVKKLQDYPDISFIEATSFESLKDQMVQDYQKRYKELTGEDVILAPADPDRLILYSCAVAIYQGLQYEDKAGKMGLLKYSTGEFLDNLAAFKGVKRNEAVPASTILRFTLAAVLSREAVIPVGKRVKGQELYFETTERTVIPAGELSVDIPAVCQVVGKTGNGYRAGDINTLVDPLPYTLKVQNISGTSGGSDRETDEELTERIYLAPSSYSTAGPEAAYEYWVKSYSQSVEECKIISETPGEVDIYVAITGEDDAEAFRKQLEAFLRNDNRRPLTDHVIVKAPEEVSYEIELTYTISLSDKDTEETIKAEVENASRNYAKWQKKIGRDITPARLIYEVMKAGAQSVTIAQPVYKEILDTQIAVAGTLVIHYGGLKDD